MKTASLELTEWHFECGYLSSERRINRTIMRKTLSALHLLQAHFSDEIHEFFAVNFREEKVQANYETIAAPQFLHGDLTLTPEGSRGNDAYQ